MQDTVGPIISFYNWLWRVKKERVKREWGRARERKREKKFIDIHDILNTYVRLIGISIQENLLKIVHFNTYEVTGILKTSWIFNDTSKCHYLFLDVVMLKIVLII